MKVLICIPRVEGFSPWRWPDWATEQLRARFPGVAIEEYRAGEDEAAFDDAEAVVGWRLRPEWLRRAKRLRWVHAPPAAVESLLTPEFAATAAVLTNGAAVHGATVAEHALALMLAMTRAIPTAVRLQEKSEWNMEAMWRAGVSDLRGATVLVVGMGRIGGGLARRLAAMEARVAGVRRHAEKSETGVAAMHPLEDLNRLLPEADWVVLALPVTAETRRLMDADRFARMRPGARLVNVGRGVLVEEAALIAALDGPLAGAALDVTAEEPLPASSPLWRHPRVLITPHTAAMTEASWRRAITYLEENLARFLAGEPLDGVVNQQIGY